MTSATESPENDSLDQGKPKSTERNEKRKRDDDSKSSRRQRRRSRSRSKDRDSRRDKKRRYVDLDKPDEDDEVYPRYYGEDSSRDDRDDRYWSKYPRREDHVIGRRYYDVTNKENDDSEKKSRGTSDDKEKDVDKSVITPRQRKTVDLLTSKTGGAYIPPAKLRMMQAEITDKSSAAYQRIAWEALKKSIHGYINKVNTSNIGIIARDLLHENIVRGRGLLCKSLIQAQAASPTFTNVYAALVAVINSKFPHIGELLLKRLVLQFKRGFKQNNKVVCISAATFIAHLVNQRVAHEILALEILTLLVESPTDDSVEVAISFLKECGQKLTEVSSKGINAIFEMLRNILHEGKLEKRIQYMIEVMFQVRKDGFKDHAAIIEELDIVDEDEQFTHLITLDDVKANNAEDVLNVFKFDDKYEENEGKYKTLSKEILDTDSESGSGSEGSDESDDDDEEDEEKKEDSTIIDNTETNLITLRRTIYLTIQSSLDFEECAHKLFKMELKPGQEVEMCHMFLDCCAEQRTYEKFYGLLAQRFCRINKIYVQPFEQIFKDTYATTHRLDANKLRNVSKFFAHLLFTDAIGWEVLDIMKLNEVDTNSSSRIFIKILFQELAEYMGLGKLNTRLKDPTMQGHFAGLFPRDNPKNTRFSINFFTSIGLGGLTDELREHLKNVPKNVEVNVVKDESNSSESDSSSSSSSSSDSDSDSSDESDSSSSSEDEDRNKSKKKKRNSDKSSPDRKSSRKSRKTTKLTEDVNETEDKRRRKSKGEDQRKYQHDKIARDENARKSREEKRTSDGDYRRKSSDDRRHKERDNHKNSRYHDDGKRSERKESRVERRDDGDDRRRRRHRDDFYDRERESRRDDRRGRREN